jgi:hypothetical protein
VTYAEILVYWGGDERGNDFAVPRADFPWCVPIATQTLHAAGAAMAFKLRGEPRCAVAYIGDGGTSEGAFYEALNLAGARALPVVFVIVNNGWAISVPSRRRRRRRLWRRRRIAAGIPGIQVDGNDVIRRAPGGREALDRAPRRGARADRGNHLPAERSHDGGRREPLPSRRRGQPRLAGRAAAAPARYLASVGAWTTRPSRCCCRSARARSKRPWPGTWRRRSNPPMPCSTPVRERLRTCSRSARWRALPRSRRRSLILAKDNDGRGHRDGAWLGNAA